MYIIPFARFSLDSPKSQYAAALLLLSAVPQRETHPELQMGNSLEYRGSVYHDGFTLIRNLNYENRDYPLFSKYNAFVPIINGSIQQTTNGSRIIVTAQFNTYATCFALLIYSVLFLVLGNYSRDAFSHGEFELTAIWLPVLLLVVLYAWQMISFNYEIHKARVFLKRAIRAQDIHNDGIG